MNQRRAENRLRKFVEDQPPATGELPLVHITRAYSFDDVLADGRLEPKICAPFLEPLVFMFYGRPAYRAKEGNNARLEFEWPIVLVFDPNKVGPIRRVFPFDTGAFDLGLYAGFFDSASKLCDFELAPVLDSAKQVVAAFYRDHEEYYTGLSRKNVDIPFRQFEAQGLHELARLPGVQDSVSRGKTRDDRSAAIEVQFCDPVPLKGNLLAVVLPEPYLEISEITERLEDWDVHEIITYPTLHNLGGEAWVGLIYSKIQDLYRKLGLW